MDGTLPKFSFSKLQGVGGSNKTPGLDGVDGIDLDHNITQSIHIISNEGASNVLSSVELGF